MNIKNIFIDLKLLKEKNKGFLILFKKRGECIFFLDKIEKFLFFFFDSFKLMKIFFMFKIWMWKKEEFEIFSYIEERVKESLKKEEEKKKENEERKCIEIVEVWDSIIFV